jgi:hypothetical protein
MLSHPFAREKAKGWGTGHLFVARMRNGLEEVPEGLVVDGVVELDFRAFDDRA